MVTDHRGIRRHDDLMLCGVPVITGGHISPFRPPSRALCCLLISFTSIHVANPTYIVISYLIS